jgi:hypothetical protein
MGSKNTPIKLKNGGGYMMDSKLVENMNLEEDVSVLVSNLKNIEGEYKKILNKYSEDFSEQDKKQQDILHYLEFNNLNSVAAYRLMKELKEVRLKRRTAEDTVNLLNNIALQLKFNSKSMDTDKILKDRKKQLDNRKYKMRCYTERQLKNIANLPIYKGGEENA